jgi:hypothetical protein
MRWKKARAKLTQVEACRPHSLVARPGFGANKITLSTHVMLSQ